jgi:uncharacterized protein (UPF0332 family)
MTIPTETRDLIQYFNIHFVKTGIFPKEFGKSLHRAFDFRQESDYGSELIMIFRLVIALRIFWSITQALF